MMYISLVQSRAIRGLALTVVALPTKTGIPSSGSIRLWFICKMDNVQPSLSGQYSVECNAAWDMNTIASD